MKSPAKAACAALVSVLAAHFTGEGGKA
jgi:hypothetical protein